MCSVGGQESYKKLQMWNPTSEQILEAFDVSMLDWECSEPPVNGGDCSPPMGHTQAVNSSYAGNSYPATASRDCSSYENDSLAGDDTHDSQLWDSGSTYPPQVTTAAESWSAAGPDSSRFPSLSQTAGQAGRKLKVYEWPPQSDPELEKKRRSAIKALRNRMRGSQLEQQQHAKLDAITRDVSRLKEEKSTAQQTVATLQAYLNQLSLSHPFPNTLVAPGDATVSPDVNHCSKSALAVIVYQQQQLLFLTSTPLSRPWWDTVGGHLSWPRRVSGCSESRHSSCSWSVTSYCVERHLSCSRRLTAPLRWS